MLKKRITFSMPNELYELLKLEAVKTGVPVTGMINIAVKQYLLQGSLLDLTELYKSEIEKQKK